MSHGPRPALASQGSGECSQREPNSTRPYHPANSAPSMDEPVRSLSVRARDARHWAGMQRDRPKPRTDHRRAFFIRVINGGATGGVEPDPAEMAARYGARNERARLAR